ncbi:Ubiquitin-conjugating enzyme E2 [Trinorchestia longiramus]|nr:Ubiquitin-conjugating enzyme E2 [Trinorchestia longiramus]
MVPGVSPQICPFQSPDWDDQDLSRRALLRCKAEINTIAKQPAPDVYIFNDEEKINCFKVLLIGPEGTPYEGGFFHFFARMGPAYPDVPPRVCAMSCYRFGHVVRFNPNMYRNGHICLSILNTWEGEKWSPEMDLRSLFLSIRSRMTSQALCKEPVFEPFEDMGLKDVWLYDMYVRHETLRVTVVEGLRTWETYDIPAKLVRHMVANFFEHYDSYIAACHTFKTYDGTSFHIVCAKCVKLVYVLVKLLQLVRRRRRWLSPPGDSDPPPVSSLLCGAKTPSPVLDR